MKKLFLMLCVSSLFSGVVYADYMCGSSPCYSEDSCDQETGYCNDCSDEGYGHNAEGKCVRCQDSNCYDDGDACEDDYTYCEECKDGYESINGKCEEIIDSSNCSENCGTCVSGGKCAYCQGGYYMENGVCKKNPENCSWYNVNEGKCGGCNSGYYMGNGNCKKNPEGCSWYNATTGKCTGCNSGYYLEINGVCLLKEKYAEMKHCSSYTDSRTCSECEDGYYNIEGRCITKEECLQKENTRNYVYPYSGKTFNYCTDVNCLSNWIYGGMCNRCTGDFILMEGRCVEECPSGYVVSNTAYKNKKKCVQDVCESSSDAYCVKCHTGYSLQDGVCVTECKEGYIAGTNSSGYPSCFPADLGCGYGEKQVGDECVAREDGEGCGAGFYLKDNLCVSESKGCGDGYLGKDGVCISSANGCGAGYKDMGGFCNRIQYTPAEAAPLLNDDNNFVILTFKK